MSARSRVLIAGASGQVGSRLAALLGDKGHDVVAASRSNGVDAFSGAGLDAAMKGVDVVVDVTNARTRDPEELRRFFEASTRNLAAAGRKAGVAHHIALSVVGADAMPDSPYMRGKIAQEQAIAAGGIPYTILRATQFFEFVAGFAEAFATDGEVRLPDARMQPIAVDDVATALARLSGDAPSNGVREVGGPEAMTIRDAVSRILTARGVVRPVTAARDVRYFGARLDRDTLVPAPSAWRGATDLDAWLGRPR
jgi:uncharacterized protein YbjT (DUF2867 family)